MHVAVRNLTLACTWDILVYLPRKSGWAYPSTRRKKHRFKTGNKSQEVRNMRQENGSKKLPVKVRSNKLPIILSYFLQLLLSLALLLNKFKY